MPSAGKSGTDHTLDRPPPKRFLPAATQRRPASDPELREHRGPADEHRRRADTNTSGKAIPTRAASREMIDDRPPARCSNESPRIGGHPLKLSSPGALPSPYSAS